MSRDFADLVVQRWSKNLQVNTIGVFTWVFTRVFTSFATQIGRQKWEIPDKYRARY